MTQVVIIPSKYQNKISYRPSVNEYTIMREVSIPAPFRWDEETLEELEDQKHLVSISRSRLEYKRGQLVEEETILAKLKR